MPNPRDNYLRYFNFYGGINTVSSVYDLQKGDFRDAQNIDLYPKGGFSKRLGMLSDLQFVASNIVTGLFSAHFTTAGAKVMSFATCGTKLFQYLKPGGPSSSKNDITGGLTLTAGRTNIWNFEILNDIVVLGNGTDAGIQIDNTPTATALTPGPFTIFKFPVQYRGYMFYFVPTVAGTTRYNRCYFSNINDPTTVGTNNFIDIGKGTGGVITGAVVYNTYLYVFTTTAIYQIIFQPTAIDTSGNLFPFIVNPNPIIKGIGTQSHRSITTFVTPSTHPTPGVEFVFFIDQFGSPRVFDGTITFNFNSKIGYSLDSTLTTLAGMDKAELPYNHAVNDPANNRLKFFMSDGTLDAVTSAKAPNIPWILDYNYGFSILRYNFGTVYYYVSALLEKTSGAFRTFGGDSTGYSYEFEVPNAANDNGSTAIQDYAIIDGIFSDPVINSKYRRLDIRGLNAVAASLSAPPSGPLTKLSYYIDGNSTAFATDTVALINLPTDTATFPQTLPSEINTVGKVLKIKIEASNKTTDFMYIEGFSVFAEPLSTSEGFQV